LAFNKVLFNFLYSSQTALPQFLTFDLSCFAATHNRLTIIQGNLKKYKQFCPIF
jgi:hypothetical protein